MRWRRRWVKNADATGPVALRLPGRRAGERDQKYETDCIHIFKPLFIILLTNTFFIGFLVILQTLSQINKTAN
jgi:hypothetical protein